MAGTAQAAIRRRADGRDRRGEAVAHAPAAGRSAEPPHPHARRALRQEAGSVRRRACANLRPRPSPHLLRRSQAPPLAGGVHLPATQPREHPAGGLEMDRRVPADVGRRFRRYDPAVPRAEAARRRLQAAAEDGFQRVVDGQDGGFALQPVAAAVARGLRRPRGLVLLHPDLMPPDSLEGRSEQEIHKWKTEYDIVTTLRAAGHDVRPLGVQDELKPIRDEVERWKPDVAFNLLEQFHGEAVYDQNVASYLELLCVPYTGCNPRGLILARGKDLSKKLLVYHRIPLPAFAVFPMRRKVRRPPRLAFPLIVKSLNEDASMGIAQASVVDNDEKLAERVSFIHESIGTAAIAEQYIEGRELYVGVLGNERLRVFPIWELEFGSMPQGARLIATEKVKHDLEYQQRHDIVVGPAKDLSPQLVDSIKRAAKRIYRTLDLDGYARIDFRLSADGIPYYLEANPNAEIARNEEFASAAKHDRLEYPELIPRILALGISRAGAVGIEQEKGA